MKISVKAHPKSKNPKVVQKSEHEYEVWVAETAEKGKANRAVIDALAEHLGLARSKLSVSSGHGSRNKVIQINP